MLSEYSFYLYPSSSLPVHLSLSLFTCLSVYLPLFACLFFLFVCIVCAPSCLHIYTPVCSYVLHSCLSSVNPSNFLCLCLFAFWIQYGHLLVYLPTSTFTSVYPFASPLLFFGILGGTFSTLAVCQSPSALPFCHFCSVSLCPSCSTFYVYYVTVFLLACLSIWLIVCI